MTNRQVVLVVLATVSCAVVQVFAQAGFSGRWSTDPPPKGWTGWNAGGVLNIQPTPDTLVSSLEGSTRAASRNTNAFPQGLLLDIKVEGNSVTGFLGQEGVWGEALKIELGTVEGKTIRFLTTRRPIGREPIYYQWVAELTDNNTMTLRGGNIAGGRGGEGARLQAGRQPAPPPTTLPPLGRSTFLPPQTLRRVN